MNKHGQTNNVSSDIKIITNQNKIAELLNKFIDDYYKGKLNGK